MKRSYILIAVIIIVLIFLGYQFMPPASSPLPENYQPELAVWMGVTWSMDVYTDDELQTLADTLKKQGVDTAYVYVSYLKAGDFFNETYDEAADFTRRMKQFVPEIDILAWIGVPISITQPDGTSVSNRLESDKIRQHIADFALLMVTEHGFDGVHLNAELIPDGDDAFLKTLQLIRGTLPDSTIFSTTSHALRLSHQVTSVPYPVIEHHASPEYLREIAKYVDEIALMAYDSGLFFSTDYRSWMNYQVKIAADTLSESNIRLLIGLPVSEEFTPSHQLQAEYLSNALAGFQQGLSNADSPEAVTGIALYPYWEFNESEWQTLQSIIPPESAESPTG